MPHEGRPHVRVQAVLIPRRGGVTRKTARAKATRIIDGAPRSARTTAGFFRFQAAPPGAFKPASFRTKKINGATIIVGRPK